MFFNGGRKDNDYDYSNLRTGTNYIVIHRIIYNPVFTDYIRSRIPDMVNQTLKDKSAVLLLWPKQRRKGGQAILPSKFFTSYNEGGESIMTQLEIDTILNYRQKLINKLFEWQKLDHEEQERIIKVVREKDIRSNPEALLACRNELLFLQKIEELFMEMVKTIQDKDGIEAMLTQFEEGEA